MKYNLNIMMEAFSRHCPSLDVTDAFILDYIKDWFSSTSSKVDRQIINGRVWIWIDYGTMIEAMPYLGISDKAPLSRRVGKLIDSKLLEKRQMGNKLYLALSETVDLLYNKPSPESDKKDTVAQKQQLEKQESQPNQENSQPLPKSNDLDLNRCSKATQTNTPSSKKDGLTDLETVENQWETWEPSETTLKTILASCRNMRPEDTKTESQRFKDHYQSKKWPVSPDSRFISWCLDEDVKYLARTKRRIRVETADELSQSRIKDFDIKKRENIDKIGIQKPKEEPAIDIGQNRSLADIRKLNLTKVRVYKDQFPDEVMFEEYLAALVEDGREIVPQDFEYIPKPKTNIFREIVLEMDPTDTQINQRRNQLYNELKQSVT